MVDVVIIGGGPAGLSAALILGRFRRSVIVSDGQRPRNAMSTGVHGFFSREGTHPQELLRIGREQLEPYSTVQLQSQEVVDIEPGDHIGHFKVTFQDGNFTPAKKILFATGVKDILPPIEGIDELWGQGVYHCPYCHGWEVRDKAIAILANGDVALHFSKLLHALTDDLVICTNGESEIASSDRLHLERLRINMIETPIQRLQHNAATLEGIAFTDGSFLPREAVFVRTATQQHSELPAHLGCAMTENGYIRVDDFFKTSVDGIYAAGDLTSPLQQVVHAASRGAAAAAFINAELAHDAFTRAE